MKKYATRRSAKRRSKTMRKQKGGRPPCEKWPKCPGRDRKFDPYNKKSPGHIPGSCFEGREDLTCCSVCNCEWGTLPNENNIIVK